MKKFATFIGLALGLVSVLDGYRRTRNESSRRPRKQDPSDSGFRMSTQTLANGDRFIRLQGGHESLAKLLNPNYGQDKPPVPEGLDIDSLPSYHCGCPHCRKMSMHGENQWRYQELSRTRGVYDNTTTYLVLCQNCNGFMKCTVDHDD